MQKSTVERHREKAREALDLDKNLHANLMARSTTPQSTNDPTSHSLSSVDEVSKEEEDEYEIGRTAPNSVTFYAGNVAGSATGADSDYDGSERIRSVDGRHYTASKPGSDIDGGHPCDDGPDTDGEMAPAIAAQREFLARLQARRLRQQCCNCCCKCCRPCCVRCCRRCSDCCHCLPTHLPRCNPCRYAGYYYAALVLACAICGAVFVSVGALQNNRKFLIAGSILCITAFGLLLHRCFRKSPYQPKGYPGFLDEEDFSSLGSEDYGGGGGHYKGVPMAGPGGPPGNAVPAIPEKGYNSIPRRPSIAYDPGQRRMSTASMAHSLGCVSNSNADPSTINYYHRSRKRNSTTSGILNLARRLSVANNTGGFNEGWHTSGHLRHKYRRSCSYPWAMARPEHHYVEYV